MSSISNTVNASVTSLVNSNISNLSDTPIRQVDSHLLEFLSMEMIKVLTQSELIARNRKIAQERLVLDPTISGVKNLNLNLNGVKESEIQGKELILSEEGVRKRLEIMGYKVGWAMAERLARDRPRFPTAPTSTISNTSSSSPITFDVLEMIKFICKDLWIELFNKQIDNLRTNHRGIYVLLDLQFKPLLNLSATSSQLELVAKHTRLILATPCGIIRGALASLGLTVSVSVESNLSPQCTFQIKTTKAS